MTACLTADATLVIDGHTTTIGAWVEAHLGQQGPFEARALTLNEQGQVVPSQILGVHRNPAPPFLVEMTTKSGQKLTLTPNHPVAVDRPDGLNWLRADEINTDDRIYAARTPSLAEKIGRSRPIRGNVERVLAAQPEAGPVLQPWLEHEDFLDTVTRVEMVESRDRNPWVYNLSLLDINSYLANGLLVKNCGCFECIVMLIPEANGVMVVNREDTSMTPAGMTFSTLAGMAGGGLQTPGVMGVGKFYLVSPKFISADGGFKRVVWMSSILKETMADEFKAVAEREGDPDLLGRIADERSVTTVEELLAWLEAHNHPALVMDPIF
jgi:hypothetical protein